MLVRCAATMCRHARPLRYQKYLQTYVREIAADDFCAAPVCHLRISQPGKSCCRPLLRRDRVGMEETGRARRASSEKGARGFAAPHLVAGQIAPARPAFGARPL